MKVKSYTRSKIPEGIKIPWGELSLVYTKHALSRMENGRSKGSLNILPKMVILAPKNLKQIWTETEGGSERLRSMMLEIPYTKGTLLQLIVSHDHVVITLYFREVWHETTAVPAELRRWGSSAGDTNPEQGSNPLRLDIHGQVIYPEGTYFMTKGRWKRRHRRAS